MRKYRQLLTLVGFFVPAFVFAATTNFAGPLVPDDIKTCAAGFGGLTEIVGGALGVMISLAVLIAVLVLAYGGFLLVLNPINAENRSKARTVIMNALIGLVLTLAAWLLVNTFLTVIGAGGIQAATQTLFTGGNKCLPTVAQHVIDGGGTPGSAGPGSGAGAGGTECPGSLVCTNGQCGHDQNLDNGTGAEGQPCNHTGTNGGCTAPLMCDATDTCAKSPGASNPGACTAGSGSGSGAQGSSKLDIGAAVSYIDSHANGKSGGECALYVRHALAAGGLTDFDTNHPADAYQYGPYLTKDGFVAVSIDPSAAKAGDVVVFQPVAGHPSGHIAMFDGSNWVSDFKQSSFYVSDAYRTGSYTIYRPGT